MNLLLPGTSTDVSRYAGQYEHVFESTTAGVTIQAPQVILIKISWLLLLRAHETISIHFNIHGHQHLLNLEYPENLLENPENLLENPECLKKWLEIWNI